MSNLSNIERIRRISLQYAKGNGPQALPKQSTNTLRPITHEWLARILSSKGRSYTKRMRLKEMKLSYANYIKSEHWRNFRRSYIAQTDGICEVTVCRNRGTILHHRTYDSLGFETYMDVFLVCGTCHNKIHDIVRARLGQARRNRAGNRTDHSPEQKAPACFLPWGGLFHRRFIPAEIESAESTKAQGDR